MTNNEKDALLGYLEFTLTTMVEGLEQKNLIANPYQVAALYDAAYEVLNEMERTLTDHVTWLGHKVD